MVDCFECRIKLGWNSPKINGKKMKEVQQLVKFSDNVLDRMNDKDVLCGDCNDKFGKRHALELYNYDKNTLSEKEWENYLKMPETKVIVQEAERILTEQHSTSTRISSSEADKYANQWASGQISYGEYERKAMASMEYYGNQYVYEMESIYDKIIID